MGSAAAAAFDRVAATYDDGFGRNPVGLLFRYVFQERLRGVFPAGARLLDVGCGTGEDALLLASAGFRVHGIDIAPGMVARARAKAEERGLPAGRVGFEVRAAEEIGGITGGFEGAYSGFGALNCADLAAVGRGLGRVLRPGAPVVVSLMGRWPLPATLERALTGRGEERGRSTPRVAGVPVPTAYPGLEEAREGFGRDLRWTGAFALGLLVPGPEHAAWAARNPQTFGLLAAVEGVVRRWPLARALGDHVVLEGVRR